MRALKNVDSGKEDEGGTNRKQRRLKRKKERKQKKTGSKNTLQASNPIFSTDNSGTKGSCEDGNLRACKTEVKKAPKFNPNRGRISNRRKVGGARQREKQAKKDERARLKEETGKTLVGRALSKAFGKKPKPRQQKHANTRFL